ncbi:MAG: bifunctional isocitrate dehydrogenase kinase/phosphatase, partial [Candidatus Omnitrophica bacterium]|nr:bifunctional isocitrate dehydrogenase kinase/phosphatase [Candidatus Omnitrophota bacterium]
RQSGRVMAVISLNVGEAQPAHYQRIVQMLRRQGFSSTRVYEGLTNYPSTLYAFNTPIVVAWRDVSLEPGAHADSIHAYSEMLVSNEAHALAQRTYGPGQIAQARVSLRKDDRVLLSLQSGHFHADWEAILTSDIQWLYAQIQLRAFLVPQQFSVVVTTKAKKRVKQNDVFVLKANESGRPFIAAAHIESKTVILHPHHFDLTDQERRRIFFHEFISHIAKGIRDEAVARRDTALFFLRGNLPSSMTDVEGFIIETYAYPNRTVERLDVEGNVFWASIWTPRGMVEVVHHSGQKYYEVWFQGKRIDAYRHEKDRATGFAWAELPFTARANALELQRLDLQNEYADEISFHLVLWLALRANRRMIRTIRTEAAEDFNLMRQLIRVLEPETMMAQIAEDRSLPEDEEPRLVWHSWPSGEFLYQLGRTGIAVLDGGYRNEVVEVGPAPEYLVEVKSSRALPPPTAGTLSKVARQTAGMVIDVFDAQTGQAFPVSLNAEVRLAGRPRRDLYPFYERPFERVENEPLARVASQTAVLILGDFDRYFSHYQDITKGAFARFEIADWQGAMKDGDELIRLYGKSILATAAQVSLLLGPRESLRNLWDMMKKEYQKRIDGRYEDDLALIYFYTVMRKIFAFYRQTVEFEDDRLSLQLLDRQVVSRRYMNRPEVPVQHLIQRILTAYHFQGYSSEDMAEDAALVATALSRHLSTMKGAEDFDAIEMLNQAAFVNKGAYLLGQISVRGGRVIPFGLALLNDKHQRRRGQPSGIYVHAVLVGDQHFVDLLRYTRASLRIFPEFYREIIEFLHVMFPDREVASLQSAIGFEQPSKNTLVKKLRGHLAVSKEGFERTEGTAGFIMITFTLPGFPYVFKVITDENEKQRGVVIKNHHVERAFHTAHMQDRTGLLLNTSAVVLNFRQDLFPEDLLTAIRGRALQAIVSEDQETISLRVYVQRRVIPLEIHWEQIKNDPEKVREVLDSYGQFLKDLAATGIMYGDPRFKNVGVKQASGRVVGFDFDEIYLLGTPLIFMWPHYESMAELLNEIGIPEEYHEFFLSRHGDLFEQTFWSTMKVRVDAGEVMDSFFYPRDAWLDRRFPGQEEVEPHEAFADGALQVAEIPSAKTGTLRFTLHPDGKVSDVAAQGDVNPEEQTRIPQAWARGHASLRDSHGANALASLPEDGLGVVLRLHGRVGPIAQVIDGETHLSYRATRGPPEFKTNKAYRERLYEALPLIFSDEIDHLLHPPYTQEVHQRLAQRLEQAENRSSYDALIFVFEQNRTHQTMSRRAVAFERPVIREAGEGWFWVITETNVTQTKDREGIVIYIDPGWMREKNIGFWEIKSVGVTQKDVQTQISLSIAQGEIIDVPYMIVRDQHGVLALVIGEQISSTALFDVMVKHLKDEYGTTEFEIVGIRTGTNGESRIKVGRNFAVPRVFEDTWVAVKVVETKQGFKPLSVATVDAIFRQTHRYEGIVPLSEKISVQPQPEDVLAPEVPVAPVPAAKPPRRQKEKARPAEVIPAVVSPKPESSRISSEQGEALNGLVVKDNFAVIHIADRVQGVIVRDQPVDPLEKLDAGQRRLVDTAADKVRAGQAWNADEEALAQGVIQSGMFQYLRGLDEEAPLRTLEDLLTDHTIFQIKKMKILMQALVRISQLANIRKFYLTGEFFHSFIGIYLHLLPPGSFTGVEGYSRLDVHVSFSGRELAEELKPMPKPVVSRAQVLVRALDEVPAVKQNLRILIPNVGLWLGGEPLVLMLNSAASMDYVTPFYGRYMEVKILGDEIQAIELYPSLEHPQSDHFEVKEERLRQKLFSQLARAITLSESNRIFIKGFPDGNFADYATHPGQEVAELVRLGKFPSETVGSVVVASSALAAYYKGRIVLPTDQIQALFDIVLPLFIAQVQERLQNYREVFDNLVTFANRRAESPKNSQFTLEQLNRFATGEVFAGYLAAARVLYSVLDFFDGLRLEGLQEFRETARLSPAEINLSSEINLSDKVRLYHRLQDLAAERFRQRVGDYNLAWIEVAAGIVAVGADANPNIFIDWIK